MPQLTEIIGQPLLDVQSKVIGKIVEIVVSSGDPLPIVAAFKIKSTDFVTFVPASHVTVGKSGAPIVLSCPMDNVAAYPIREDDFSLVNDVLNKEIVDIHDCTVVKVQDVRLEPVGDGTLTILGVEPEHGGWAERLGLTGAMNALGKLINRPTTSVPFIPWNDVESLPIYNANEPIRLRIPYQKLAKLHPSDLGEILNQLDSGHRKRILESLDLETAAEALSEADEDVQVQTLQELDGERAADILEEMPADEAADVLGDMDEARRGDLLGRMNPEDREDVVELLEYHDQSAGGMMTSEYVAIPSTFSARKTIETLRGLEPDAETIYYIYVVDLDECLVGVISLRDLIVALPDARVEEFMIRKVRCVPLDADIDDVAHAFEKYKLLALPVVDGEGRIQGIITVDDTLEQLLPPDWRKRFPRRA